MDTFQSQGGRSYRDGHYCTVHACLLDGKPPGGSATRVSHAQMGGAIRVPGMAAGAALAYHEVGTRFEKGCGWVGAWTG